jgi:hypothetical protein
LDLSLLSPAQKQAIEMRYAYGSSFDDFAHALRRQYLYVGLWRYFYRIEFIRRELEYELEVGSLRYWWFFCVSGADFFLKLKMKIINAMRPIRAAAPPKIEVAILPINSFGLC